MRGGQLQERCCGSRKSKERRTRIGAQVGHGFRRSLLPFCARLSGASVVCCWGLGVVLLLLVTCDQATETHTRMGLLVSLYNSMPADRELTPNSKGRCDAND